MSTVLSTSTSGQRGAPVKVLIADDHPVVRHGLKTMIEADPDLQVVGEATNVDDTVALAVAGAADNVSAVFRSTIMLSATPEAMRGRLTGIEFMQVASAPTLGNVEAGVVASVTSLRFSIVSGGLLCVVGTLVVAALFPALLRYDAKRDKLT